ncbi:Methylamine utilization protein MauE [Enhygromyxa salina]|uniref:Methylamine utilization protein MauE n=1 Tax=Enhygromyxa salina TaxID=215803 RepID=A0A2S9XD87_9BACT|nr:MauE/DoxX family redox-associated membrane protein [Enhygromyxa salina]PRP90730.1 Methylamine utilization protein MauE [Enhygromyxa salina]
MSASNETTPTPKWMLAAGWAGRLIASSVFIYAAVIKILDPAAFAEDIANYQAFPHWTWNLAAAVVPIAELLGALAVLTGFKRRAGTLVLGSLTLAFIGLILSVIVRGIDLNCGCFGEAAEASAVGWPLLLRDLGLLVAIGAAYLPPERRDA